MYGAVRAENGAVPHSGEKIRPFGKLTRSIASTRRRSQSLSASLMVISTRRSGSNMKSDWSVCSAASRQVGARPGFDEGSASVRSSTTNSRSRIAPCSRT